MSGYFELDFKQALCCRKKLILPALLPCQETLQKVKDSCSDALLGEFGLCLLVKNSIRLSQLLSYHALFKDIPNVMFRRTR